MVKAIFKSPQRISRTEQEMFDPTVFNGLKRLSSFGARAVSYVETVWDELTMISPNLRYISTPWEAAATSKLRSGSVTKLHMLSYQMIESIEDAPLVLIEDKHWTTVTDLVIPYMHWTSQLFLGNVRLSNLRTISVGIQPFVANLYRSMVVRPDYLLVLEEVSISVVMEWDILLIMLERRLIARSRDYMRMIIIMNLRRLLIDRHPIMNCPCKPTARPYSTLRSWRHVVPPSSSFLSRATESERLIMVSPT